MKPRAILEEAWRNSKSGVTRGVIAGALLGIVIFVSSSWDILSIARLIHLATQFQEAGASTIVYTDKGQIDAGACDGLRHLPDVVAAGAISQAYPNMTALALSQEEIPTFDVSPGFRGFTALRMTGNTEFAVSRAAAENLHVGTYSFLPMTNGLASVSGTFSYPQDGRLDGLNYSIIERDSHRRRFNSCWVEMWPRSQAVLDALPSTLSTSSLTEGSTAFPTVQQLNVSDGSDYDLDQLLDDRDSRFASVVVGAAGLLIGFTTAWLRRLEFSSDMHAGLSRRSLQLLIGVETLMWSGPAAIIGALAVLLYLALTRAPEVLSAEVSVVCVLTSAVLWPIVGASIAAASVRERHMFRLFKSRL